ncbi:MAG: hypothetical protein AB8G05_13095 [Oligoflexales bacterium]
MTEKRNLLILIDDDPFFRELWATRSGSNNIMIFDYIENFFSAEIDLSKVFLLVLDYEIDQSDIIDLCYVSKLRNAGYNGPIALSSMHSFKNLEPEKQKALRETVDFIIPKKPLSLREAQKLAINKENSPFANF